jgi:predicted ArsR family transcriptional regulator
MRAYTEAQRPAVLDLLKIHGPTNAPALARLRGVSLTAVRQQLAALRREGLVEIRVEKRRVGRPTHLFALTDTGDARFPQAYGPLALSLLRQIRGLDGDAKIEKLLERRTRELAKAYRKRVKGRSAAERWRELARVRAEEGYMARASKSGLAEYHCPIAAIAREFPQVCRFEAKLFEAVVGRPLERIDHLASGGRACVYAAAPRRRR